MSARVWGRRRLDRWRREFVIATFWQSVAEDQHERDEASRIIRRLVTRARRYGVRLE